MRFRQTGLWADVREVPGALAATLDAAEGLAAAAELLRSPKVTRIVATGNGAAYYVAQALWLASLESRAGGPPVVAVPCGVAARGTFAWRPGDALLAVSSSGEFRDVVEVARRSPAWPCVALTAAAGSSLAAAASVAVVQRVAAQRAVTHTQALAGACGLGLALLAAVTGDKALGALAASAPEVAEAAVAEAEAWAARCVAGLAPPAAAVAVGGGPAWAAALELALMLKEVARIPAEGVETREGATSAMFGLARGHLVASFDPSGDRDGEEALRLCAAAGATTLRMPAPADARLALVTALPAAVALAAELALAAGHDVDRPAWSDAYYETAR